MVAKFEQARRVLSVDPSQRAAEERARQQREREDLDVADKAFGHVHGVAMFILDTENPSRTVFESEDGPPVTVTLTGGMDSHLTQRSVFTIEGEDSQLHTRRHYGESIKWKIVDADGNQKRPFTDFQPIDEALQWREVVEAVAARQPQPARAVRAPLPVHK